MAKAVIFDKDGVLMLTEEIYFRGFASAMKHFGGNKEFTWEEHYQYIGSPTTETFFSIREKYGLNVSFYEFYKIYKDTYLKIMQNEGITVPDGVEKLLQELKAENIPFAIGTGGSRSNVEMSLKRTGLDKYFDITVSATDVSKGKPDPETFLLAAEKLNINPHECVVIGDAINDVLGARSAGIKMIAITDKSYIEDPELASPDMEVKKFSEITIDMIKSI